MTSVDFLRSCSAAKRNPAPTPNDCRRPSSAWRSARLPILSMRASSGLSGVSPADSMAASSMQLAQKSPTFFWSEPAGAFLSAAAFSRTLWRFARLVSSRIVKDPQYDWSGGIGFALSQPPLAYTLKSVHAETDGYMSAGFSPGTGAGVAWGSGHSADRAGGRNARARPAV